MDKDGDELSEADFNKVIKPAYHQSELSSKQEHVPHVYSKKQESPETIIPEANNSDLVDLYNPLERTIADIADQTKDGKPLKKKLKVDTGKKPNLKPEKVPSPKNREVKEE